MRAFQELREFRMRHEHEWRWKDLKRKREFEGLKEIENRRDNLGREGMRSDKRSIKQWAREVMDQKANSIADLAAVLKRQENVSVKHARQVQGHQALNEAAKVRAMARKDELTDLMRAEWVEGENQNETYNTYKIERRKMIRALAKPNVHAAVEQKYAYENDNTPMDKRGRRHPGYKAPAPLFTMNGVKIEWADITDAEFAQSWPVSVVHGTLERGEHMLRDSHTTVIEPALTQEEVKRRLLEAETIGRDPERRQPVNPSNPPSSKAIEDVVPDDKEPSLLQRLMNRLTVGNRS